MSSFWKTLTTKRPKPDYVPPASVKQKTADEMFRALGYYKDWRDSTRNNIRYKQGLRSICIYLEGYNCRGVFKSGDYKFSPEEILACAKLIKELEDEE